MNDGITARLNRLIEGGAAACPLASRGQESVDLPKFGLLYPGPADAAAARTKIVWEGLKESGYVEGRNQCWCRAPRIPTQMISGQQLLAMGFAPREGIFEGRTLRRTIGLSQQTWLERQQQIQHPIFLFIL
jgi:hypothetical protein